MLDQRMGAPEVALPPETNEVTERASPESRFHSQSKLLKNALKNEIRNRGFCYQDVASALGVSVITIKRHLNSDRVPMEAIEEICAFLGLSLLELAEMAKTEETASGRDLTVEQEKALSEDYALALVRFLIYSGWTADEIKREYDLDDALLVPILVRLDRMGLIELMPYNRVRVKGRRTIEWKSGGPMRQVMEKDIRENFLQMSFAEGDDFYCYETVELSPSSLAQLEEQMRDLARTARMLHQIDRNITHRDKQWTTLLLVTRHNFWGFPMRDGGMLAPRSFAEAGSKKAWVPACNRVS